MARRMESREPEAVRPRFLALSLTPVLAGLFGLLLTGLLLTGCAGSPRETLPEPPPEAPQVEAVSAAVDCSTAEGVAGMVCEADELIVLDQELSEVMQNAEKQEDRDQHARLHAIQDSWLRQRDDCAQQADQQRCVSDAYKLRIAQLQARHGLVEQRGPLSFVCKDRSVSEVTVTWFDTVPEALIASRGDSQSLMVRQAGESVYRGRNESLSEQGAAITLVWGHGAPQIRCQATR